MSDDYYLVYLVFYHYKFFEKSEGAKDSKTKGILLILNQSTILSVEIFWESSQRTFLIFVGISCVKNKVGKSIFTSKNINKREYFEKGVPNFGHTPASNLTHPPV